MTIPKGRRWPKQRLSDSILWDWQRSFFERRGIRAWSEGSVPHHITSNPFIAAAYARVVFGFLRDCRAEAASGEAPGSRPLDAAQPVNIIELGSGPGRFGYLFLKALLDLRAHPLFRDVRVRYVLTDLARPNLDHLHEHPWLQTFFEAGVLDLARFDVETDREMTLLHSGDVLAPGTISNPLVVIANYLFDSIPQDAFAIADGRLYELLLTTTLSGDAPDPDDSTLLAHAELEYHGEPVEGPYYADPTWNLLLDEYRRRLNDTTFLFPTAGLRCVESLRELSGGRMLLLTADRGYSRDEALLGGTGSPRPLLHGSFSMAVDYQLLGEYCRHRGGLALHPTRRRAVLHISAFLFGRSPGDYCETRQAYGAAIDRFGPDDFYRLKEGVDKVCDSMTLEEILAFLRLSGWDHRRLRACLPALKRGLSGATDVQRQDLLEAVQQVWDTFFPIGEEDNLAFELGMLSAEIGSYAEAVTYFLHSIALHGMAPETAFNMALCHHLLRQSGAAREWIEKALALNPDWDEARSLRIAINPA